MNGSVKKIGKFGINELSKIHLVRTIFPSMHRWYQSNVVTHPNGHKFLGGHPSRILKQNMLWRYAPKKYVGGTILNLLGLQGIRYVVHNILRNSASQDNYLNPLRKKGVQKVKKMLSSDKVRQLNRFNSKYNNQAVSYTEDFSELIVFPNEIENSFYNEQDIKDMSDLVFQTLDVAKLYQDMSGKQLNVVPFVSILHSKSYLGEQYAHQLDGQDVPHKDVFYPSYKLFIYLNDVDEKNGAFMYYPDTHSYSLRYILSEYLASLHYYLFERSGVSPSNVFKFRKPSEVESMTGLAGDGVLFNVAGAHRRGCFLKDKFRERLVLLIDFRQQEALMSVKSQQLSSNVLV